MFILQPINRWDHRPCKELLDCCHFLGRQGSHKMRISLLGRETEKRKTLLSELRRRTEWELRKDMRSRMPSEEQEWRLHGCRLNPFCLMDGKPSWANNRGFYPSRKVLWYPVTMPEGWVPTTFWDTKSFEFDQTRVYIGKDLNIISSTLKYTLHLLSFLKHL